jgi:hypothetical protein
MWYFIAIGRTDIPKWFSQIKCGENIFGPNTDERIKKWRGFIEKGCVVYTAHLVARIVKSRRT